MAAGCAVLLYAGLASVVFGETLVFDLASHYAGSGWTPATAFGTGWDGGWQLSESGCFLAKATGNPRLRLGNVAFGLWSTNSHRGEAIRKFASPLLAGDVFTVRWQNLYLSSTYGQSVGVALQDASGKNVLQFFCNAGQGYYRVGDSSPSSWLTSLPETNQVVEVKIHLLSANRYRLTANGFVAEGTYSAAPVRVRFWNSNGRGGGDNDCFFDEPTVIRTVAPGTSWISPESPQECDEVFITYDAAGGPLADAQQVVLHIGRNGGRNPKALPMELLPDGLWRAAVPLRSQTLSLEWNFHDGAPAEERVWDSNRLLGWQVGISPCDSAGFLAIDAPVAGQRVPNTTAVVRVSGRAVDLQGSLLWENETTGQSGSIPAAEEWAVEEVALAGGTNRFRISGMTLARSPNAGAYDSASEEAYRDNGWLWRQNAGAGWGEWSLILDGDGGHFIATSSSTNLVIAPYAWGLHSRNGGRSTAVRRFHSPLRVGEVVRMKFQNNSVGSGGSVGVSFRDGRDERLLSFTFVGGQQNYAISDDVSTRDTGIPWSNAGLDLSFMLTSPTTYRFTVNAMEFTGNLNPTADGQIRLFRFWSENAGSGEANNVYLTDLSIEGATVAGRELTARQILMRTPGPVLSMGGADADGYFRIHAEETDPAYAYSLSSATNLVAANWVSGGAAQRGGDGALTFTASNDNPVVFLKLEGGRLRNWEIHNPYAGVDWKTFEQHKAAIHMHTRFSDGGSEPSEALDTYIRMGYTILSITDHDTMGRGANYADPNRGRTTWPWEAHGRVHEAFGVLAIEGNEISKLAHHNSFFSPYGNPDIQSERESIEDIAALGGLVFMNHPGKYITNREEPPRETSWYVQIFRDYPHVVGIEAYNQGNRYAGDDHIWDDILTELAAERPVWGFSNDDMHNIASHLGYNGDIMLMPELSEFWMRKAMTEGKFFFFYSPRANHAAIPRVQSITVNEADGIISIQADNVDRIEWISEGTTIHTGEQIELASVSGLGSYVRAVLHGPDNETILGTQPFRVSRAPLPE